MESQGLDDRELLDRFRRGETEAFETFYRRHKDGLYRFLLLASRDSRTAEDLVQRTFLKLVEKVPGTLWKGPKHPVRWLYRVGINLWRDEARRRRRVTGMPEDIAETLPDRRNSGPADHDETAETVLRAVADLPEKHRTVVSLHHLAGLDLKETARVLGLPVGTVKSRLAKAMELLARRLRHLRP